MKRTLTNTAPKLPGLVPTYSQVRARPGQAGVNEVMAQLYHIANDRFKTPQQISATLKNCVINNSAILSQPDAGSAFAEAFVMMIPKSDLGMTPHDINVIRHELEQQAPYEMRMALMRCHQNGFDGFLTEGIARYQAATGKQVALNTMDLFNGVNYEVVGGEIVNGLSLSVQIALARTSKSQYNIFQQVYDLKIENKSTEVIELKKIMSPYAIYNDFPELRKFQFFADDEKGLTALRNLNIGGPNAIKNIKSAVYKSRKDALESRRIELEKLVGQWDQLPTGFKNRVMGTVMNNLDWEDVVRPSSKERLELFSTEGMKSRYVKYIGDGSLGIKEAIDCYAFARARNEFVESVYVDNGLMPVLSSFCLSNVQVDFLALNWVKEYAKNGTLTSEDIKLVLGLKGSERPYFGLPKDERPANTLPIEVIDLKHTLFHKLINKAPSSYSVLYTIYDLKDYQKNLFRLRLIADTIINGTLPIKKVYDLNEIQCNFLRELLSNKSIGLTLEVRLLPNLFSWKLDVLLNCGNFKQKIEVGTESLNEFLGLPDFVEEQLRNPKIQQHIDNGSLTLKRISEMADLGMNKFNERMDWIDMTGDPSLTMTDFDSTEFNGKTDQMDIINNLSSVYFTDKK